ncbi:MAG: TIGR00159 family protein [Bacteroidaceae bacterium]|nr:TIGR00159 family protein [Bacteroidaceae bacterium]
MDFGIKDAIDVLMVATLLFYTYRLMKDSGTINIFVGVIAFIIVWVVFSKILDMNLIGSILDMFINVGMIVIVILFQDQIKRVLTEMGSQNRWKHLRSLWRKEDEQTDRTWIMSVVYACMSMARSKTGALIVIQRSIPLDTYEESGDMIHADINTRLIENIFFKNSPLHDGALIIANRKIMSAGCILPVSHDRDVPRSLGLRHRSALGIAQATDAIAIIVSEETGNISLAHKGELKVKLSSVDLERMVSQIIIGTTTANQEQ